MNIMKKSTCKYLTFTIYRHVALPGCHHGDHYGVGWGTAKAQPSQASYMQWSFLAGGNFWYLRGV